MMPEQSQEDPRLGIVLREAIRAIEGQQSNVDNLRSRVGVLLSAASIATAFLGGLVFQRESVGFLGIAAVILFAIHVAFDLHLLWPREFTFQSSPRVLLDAWIDERAMDVNRMQRVLARYLEKYWDANMEILRRLWRAYAWAIGILGAEILLWLLELGGFEHWARGVLSL